MYLVGDEAGKQAQERTRNHAMKPPTPPPPPSLSLPFPLPSSPFQLSSSLRISMRLHNNLIRRPRQASIRSLPGCFGLIPHSRVTKTHILLVQDHSRIEIFVFIDGSARVELTFNLCAEADGAADLF